jgi:hypothetical protein
MRPAVRDATSATSARVGVGSAWNSSRPLGLSWTYTPCGQVTQTRPLVKPAGPRRPTTARCRHGRVLCSIFLDADNTVRGRIVGRFS